MFRVTKFYKEGTKKEDKKGDSRNTEKNSKNLETIHKYWYYIARDVDRRKIEREKVEDTKGKGRHR
jgi:hypothetical protein